jgi:hypothetical protein
MSKLCFLAVSLNLCILETDLRDWTERNFGPWGGDRRTPESDLQRRKTIQHAISRCKICLQNELKNQIFNEFGHFYLLNLANSSGKAAFMPPLRTFNVRKRLGFAQIGVILVCCCSTNSNFIGTL